MNYYETDEIINNYNLTNNHVLNDLAKFHNQRDHQRKEKYFQFLIIITLVYVVVIILGTIIFMFMFDLTWVDALYTAVLILTGIHINVVPITDSEKIFIVFYALLTVIILLSLANISVIYFLI